MYGLVATSLDSGSEGAGSLSGDEGTYGEDPALAASTSPSPSKHSQQHQRTDSFLWHRLRGGSICRFRCLQGHSRCGRAQMV